MAIWLIPVTTKDFDLNKAMWELGKTEWNETPATEGMAVGDTAFLYEGKPVRAVTWKCTVTAVHRTTPVLDDTPYYKSEEGPENARAFGEAHEISCYELTAVKAISKASLPLFRLQSLDRDFMNALRRPKVVTGPIETLLQKF